MIESCDTPGSPAFQTNQTVSDLCSTIKKNYSTESTVNDKDETNQISYISPRQENSFFKMLAELYSEKELCDVTLKVSKKTFKCHRIVLASESPYFRAMFLSKCRESKQETIVLQDIDDETFEQILDYIYKGKIRINQDNFQSLLIACCLLQISELKELCCCFIGSNLDFQNCLGIFSLLDTIGGCEDVLSMTREFLLTNFKTVTQNEEFLHLKSHQLMEIISSDDLQVGDEEIVYGALMRWVYYDVQNRRKCLPDLLKHVRLPLLSPSFLVKTVSYNNLIKSNKICRNLLDEAKNYHLLGEEGEEGPRTRPRRGYDKTEILMVIGGWFNGNSLSAVEKLSYNISSNYTLLRQKTMSLKSFTQFPNDYSQKYTMSLNMPKNETNQEQLRIKDNCEFSSPMNSSRCGVGVVYYCGHIYAIGGHDGRRYLNTFEKYNVEENLWTMDSSLMLSRRASGGVVLHNESIYAIGGQDGPDSLDAVEAYNFHTGKWIKRPSMNCYRLGLGVASLDDGRIFAVGGTNQGAPVKSTEYIDPREGKWHLSRHMTKVRKHMGIASHRGLIYAIGGTTLLGEESSTEVYDSRADAWRELSAMTTARSGVALTVLNETFLAIGGYDGKTYLNSYEEYNPELDEWILRGTTKLRRLGCGSVKVPSYPFYAMDS